MPIRIETPDLSIRLDMGRVAKAAAEGHAKHCARALLAGQRADGRGPLPRNKKGLPLGRGSGTIAHQWSVERGQGGAASSVPFQEGGYRYAVRRIEREGADIASVDGAAERAIKSAVVGYLDEALS